MMQTELAIHAGLHKTGTSYIQAYCDHNRARLLRDGIHYPKFSHTHHNAFVAYSRADRQVGYDKQASWLAQHADKAPRMLLSSEEFSIDFRSLDHCKHYARLFARFDLRIAFYLRRPDHLLESVYAQINQYRPAGPITEVPFALDVRDALGPATEVFGKDALLIRPYHAAHWHQGDIAQDLLHHLYHLPSADHASVAQQNVALSRRKTLFLASLEVAREERQAIHKVLTHSDSIADDGQKFCAPPAFRQQMYDLNRPTTARVLAPFGITDVEAFFGYDGPEDLTSWTPPAPLSAAESEAVQHDLAAAGLSADLIMRSRNTEIF